MSDKKRQSNEDRDLAAIKRRREDDDPVITIEDEIDTAPTDVVKFRLENDPAFRALWDRVGRIKKEERRAIRTTADAALAAHQRADESSNDELVRELENDVISIKNTLSIAKWLIGFLIATVLGSIIVLATKIFTWGYSSGELEIRLKHLEQEVGRGRRDYSAPLFVPDIGKVTKQ